MTDKPSLLNMSKDRLTIDKKRIINNDRAVDCNQLVPIKYKWAWHYYLDGCANHWMPTEVSMQRDIEQWKNPQGFTQDERHVIKRVFGFFATAESLVGNNLVLAVYRCVDSPECRQYLLRQAFEEAIHIHAFQYIVQSLSLDEGEMFNMYRDVDSIYNKDKHAMSCTDMALDPTLDTTTKEGLQTFIKNLVGLYVITEGIFFYGGFVTMLSFGRQNRLPGTCEQIQYILDRITEKGEIHFLSLVHGMREKIRLVITFVALLELTKMEKIGIKESTVFNDFLIYGIANG